MHEFTSIKGVREDVTDIVLNVKSLALKSSSEGTKKLILDTRSYIFCNDVKKINFKITKIKEDTGLLGAGLLFN